MSNLTPQQEKFAQLVAEGNSYANSYKGAYNASKMGINTIYVKSSELMSEDKISVRVRQIQEARAKRNEVTLDEVIKELSEWLRFDPIEFFDENNCIKNMHDLSPVARKQIADIRIQELWGKSEDGFPAKTGEIKNIKFMDKQAVADKFMKFFGAYIDNHKIVIEDLSYLDDILKEIAK